MKVRVSGMVCSASGLAMLLVLSGCRSESKDVLAKRDYIPAPQTDVSVPEQSPAMVMQPSEAVTAMQPAEEVPAVTAPAAGEAPAKVEAKPEVKPQPASTYRKFVGNTSRPTVKPGSASVPRSGAKAGDGVYTVQRGDSLSGIAHRCGVKTADLAAVNGLSLDSTIRVGQKLKLPAGGKAVAATASKKSSGSGVKSSGKPAAAKTASRPADGVYVVQKNDSLWTIARKFDTTVVKLCELNDIPANKALQLGQKIKLPGASAAADSAVEAKPAAGTASVSGSASSASAVPASYEASATGMAGDVTPSVSGTESAQPTAAEAAVATGAADAAAAEPATRTQVVQRDVEVTDLCKLFNWDVEEFKRLNPNLPADGILRRDQVITVPVKK